MSSFRLIQPKWVYFPPQHTLILIEITCIYQPNMVLRCPNGQYYFEKISLSQNIEYRVSAIFWIQMIWFTTTSNMRLIQHNLMLMACTIFFPPVLLGLLCGVIYCLFTSLSKVGWLYKISFISRDTLKFKIQSSTKCSHLNMVAKLNHIYTIVWHSCFKIHY